MFFLKVFNSIQIISSSESFLNSLQYWQFSLSTIYPHIFIFIIIIHTNSSVLLILSVCISISIHMIIITNLFYASIRLRFWFIISFFLCLVLSKNLCSVTNIVNVITLTYSITRTFSGRPIGIRLTLVPIALISGIIVPGWRWLLHWRRALVWLSTPPSTTKPIHWFQSHRFAIRCHPTNHDTPSANLFTVSPM